MGATKHLPFKDKVGVSQMERLNTMHYYHYYIKNFNGNYFILQIRSF